MSGVSHLVSTTYVQHVGAVPQCKVPRYLASTVSECWTLIPCYHVLRTYIVLRKRYKTGGSCIAACTCASICSGPAAAVLFLDFDNIKGADFRTSSNLGNKLGSIPTEGTIGAVQMSLIPREGYLTPRSLTWCSASLDKRTADGPFVETSHQSIG